MNAPASSNEMPATQQASLASRIRHDFPILATQMHGKPLVYFDNGATTQKPQSVIDSIVNFYQRDNANVHRGIYDLSQRATERFETARRTVAKFLGGVDESECIFTRGTTESINLVAYCWGRTHLQKGDQILLSGLEHHSNIVPWQMVCEATGSNLVVVQPNELGEINIDDFQSALSERTRLVAVQHVSNSLGTIHDIQSMIRLARSVGAKILVDGAQSVAHLPTDLPNLDCDFFAFSGHKLYGPTGIGILWGRREIMENLPPFLGGGDMIESVSFSGTTYAGLPNRFEAGTPNIAGAIGLGAAIEYVQSIGFEAIHLHEASLLAHMNDRLGSVGGVRIVGRAKQKSPTFSFLVEDPPLSPLDVATELSHHGIAIRTGHHCCMPLMQHYGIPGTCRASLAMYNTVDEIDYFVDKLQEFIESKKNRIGRTPSGNGQNSAILAASGSSQSIVDMIHFAEASGFSPTAVAEEIEDDFLFCDDPQSKTKLLLEFGEQLPHAFDQLKAMSTCVPGCMSEVYLIGRPDLKDPNKIEFAGDSNAEIVRGLIGLLQKLFSGQPAHEVLAFDLEGFFRRIGLEQFITSQRRSGLAGMVKRIRKLAEGITHPNS
jgi:cysteine desulfurase/selenocysteine lyase